MKKVVIQHHCQKHFDKNTLILFTKFCICFVSTEHQKPHGNATVSACSYYKYKLWCKK